ncbi:MAG: zinc ribbon domain-containing protein [Kiritimatiellaeota bacterium]|nr:zinc ribbon domain-containing protein [Kiritimatiellota bacterium]
MNLWNKWQGQSLWEIFRGWLRDTAAKESPEQPTEIVPDDAVPVCHRCLAPNEPTAHFCSECGASIGLCNNYLPWEQIASIGEVARSGVGPEARFTPLHILGYVLFGLVEYHIFSPLYFVQLFRNFRRHRQTPTSPMISQPPPPSGTG